MISTIKETIMTGLSTVEGFLADYNFLLFISFLCLSMIVIIILLYTIRYARGMKLRWRQSLLLVQKIQPEKGLEQNLTDLLELIDSMVEAPTYVFYLYDESKKVYLLKAVRHRSQSFGKVEPSYSGLVEYKKEQYLPPLSLIVDETTEQLRVHKVGEVSLLNISVGEKQGIIRVGPMRRGKYNKRIERDLRDFTEMMKHALHQFIAMEQIRNKANIVVSTGQALQRINSIALDSKVTIDFILRLAVKVMNADGAFFCTLHDKEYLLTAVSGTDETLLEGFLTGEPAKDLFDMRSAQEDIRLIRQNDDSFYQIPAYVAAIGAEAYVIVDVSERRENLRSRMLVMWFKDEPSDIAWKESHDSLSILADDMREILGYQMNLKKFSGSYVNILKTLSQLQDNLTPHTVGYSELMSRYSVVIANEMGLDEEVIRDIALAAYLSNIGVIGISTDFINKEGKFSEEEFELMKLHSEVGASIVQSTLGNEQVSSYILHHHERMDGNGYPAGISNNEIPVGARIIAVVQTFLAIINGRKYRDPVPFDQALQTLQAAAGAQLDSNIIAIFLKWFKKKQADPQISGRSLGVCWEMCCTPSNICENCPAYKRVDVNCWEIDGNNCQSHGKKCKTCFVRTETISREEIVFK
jgi:HD-GYP domain-containing protein (c-di-GMP phosphodiesterase class II)